MVAIQGTNDGVHIGSADTAVLNRDVNVVFICRLRLEVNDLELIPLGSVVYGVSLEFEFGRHILSWVWVEVGWSGVSRELNRSEKKWKDVERREAREARSERSRNRGRSVSDVHT